METDNTKIIFEKLRFGENAFHELMKWRIRRILIVLPHYDAWILENDAKITDQIVGEYHQFNLTTVPHITTVADGEDALVLLQKKEFDLVIIGMRIGDLSPEELATKAVEINPNIAVLMLLSSRSDLASLGDNPIPAKDSKIDAHFVWTGDSRLLLAMIKYIEDQRNAPNDLKDECVGALLLVEDSILFYSSYLPLLYSEVMTHTQRLIAEEMNDTDKYWRMRTRPKVLLTRSWEEALHFGNAYKDSIIGVISDISFRKNGKLDERAGFSLIDQFRSTGIRVPVLFQSSNETLQKEAEKYEAQFQSKTTNTLHQGIRLFLLRNLGFGFFVFREPDGREVRKVKTLRDFELALNSVSAETIMYHNNRNDFYRWLIAHGAYNVARKIKSVYINDLSEVNEHRKFLLRAFYNARKERHRGRLLEFSLEDPGVIGCISRYGGGSLGGKGRGLAFFNALLHVSKSSEQFTPLSVEIPATLIIATDEFDNFIYNNELHSGDFVNDEELKNQFLSHPLPSELKTTLFTFAQRNKGPLAVRSSSLLEDSQSIPCAGIYDTYMIPDNGNLDDKGQLLCDAVKLVWASTFSLEAEQYREALGTRQGTEKMAVVIQQVAGQQHDGYWFPRLSGTAQSLNYYPIDPMTQEDGVSNIALGLGRAVVEGYGGLLFCPKHPEIAFGTEEDRWKEGQTHFWALRCHSSEEQGIRLIEGEGNTLECLPIRRAETMKILRHIASTWDSVSHRLIDGIETQGPRVIDFKDILNYKWLPLASLLDSLLQLFRKAMGIPVELEFALDWDGDLPQNAIFSLLQVRPLISQENPLLSSSICPDDSQLFLRSDKSLGQGMIRNISDVVWIDPELYDPLKTEEFRDQIITIMEELAKKERYAILIGPGRWGSRDRFLGVPITWGQVCQSKLIVEVSRNLSDPEPSQGSHFFHNLVALGVGYAHVSLSSAQSFVDWNILRQNSKGNGPVYHSVFDSELHIMMDGKKGKTWVYESDKIL